MTIAMTADSATSTAKPVTYTHPIPVTVQVISTILFAAFAIPVTIVALNVFWPGGIALAIILAWRGGFAPGQRAATPIEDTVKALLPTSSSVPQSSGNASFDAYRSDLMARLETEQANFENFLGRLRDAKDKSEFDKFMDDRAATITHDDAA